MVVKDTDMKLIARFSSIIIFASVSAGSNII